MSVTYEIVLKDGQSGLKAEVGCFGALRDGESFIKWEIDGWSAKSNPVSHVNFYLSEIDREFYDYLMELPFIQAGVEDLDLTQVEVEGYTYKGVLSVSAEVNGHHLINIMSMFRTPWSFPRVITTWKYLIGLGIREDIAHVLAFYVEKNEGAVRARSTVCSEHSYFHITKSKECFQELLDYLQKEDPGAARDVEEDPFRVTMKYHRDNYPHGVVCQSIGYSDKIGGRLGTDLGLKLVNERKFVDIDEERAVAIRAKYDALPSTPENEDEMYKELRDAIVNSGVEEVPMSDDEVSDYLLNFAKEFE